jgi:ribokinase
MSEENEAETEMKPKKPKIVVFGSLNVDHTMRVDTIPVAGETVLSNGLLTCFGGKGANQALAARRAGASVDLIGTVGVDDFGVAYRSSLAREGVGVTGLGKAVAKPTGSAFAVVDSKGENLIVVNPGANYTLNEEGLEEHRKAIGKATVLLMQLECSMEAVTRAAEMARESEGETLIVINPSPWSGEFLKAKVPCDVLIVNEKEEEDLGGAAKLLKSAYAKKAGLKMVVVTAGAKATKLYTGAAKPLSITPPKVKAVDTVGAGDSFAGAFAVALAEGQNQRDSLKFANTAGALATLKPGAQSSIPMREEIEDQLG